LSYYSKSTTKIKKIVKKINIKKLGDEEKFVKKLILEGSVVTEVPFFSFRSTKQKKMGHNSR